MCVASLNNNKWKGSGHVKACKYLCVGLLREHLLRVLWKTVSHFKNAEKNRAEIHLGKKLVFNNLCLEASTQKF